MLKAGFAQYDITPRAGVGLYGFGPYLNRHAVAVRDYLDARAAVFALDGKMAVIIGCDLCTLQAETCALIRDIIIARIPGLAKQDILIATSHTHSGPATVFSDRGWGTPDPPYMEILPYKIAQAGILAAQNLEAVTVSAALVPCRHIGLNRVYDRDAPPLADVLKEDWEPAKPELTDTECRVIRFDNQQGELKGFMAYFGCHPVVCCQQNHFIHGDYPAIAIHNLMRECPGSTGIFLQGAQGDVNSGCVHKAENESLLALDVFAARFANAVRKGLAAATPLQINDLATISQSVEFSTRSDFTMEHLKELQEEFEKVLHTPLANDDAHEVRMATVNYLGVNKMMALLESGEKTSVTAEVQGIRLGPLAFLGAPFEIMQAIKNETVSKLRAPMPMVMSLCNGACGYAPDRQSLEEAKTSTRSGGYAATRVPFMQGRLPYANIHDELVNAFTNIAATLFPATSV